MAERKLKAVKRRTGGRPAKISRARILAEVRQMNGELSFSRIAERLGVRQPALYYHFASRDELLDALMVELAKEFVPQPGDPQRWRPWLEQTALEFHDFLLANPAMLTVENWHGFAMVGQRLIEAVLETLAAAGYSVEQAGRTWDAISHMTYSHARLIHEVRRAGPGLATRLAGRRPPAPGPRTRAWQATLDRDPRRQLAETLHWIVAGLPEPGT